MTYPQQPSGNRPDDAVPPGYYPTQPMNPQGPQQGYPQGPGGYAYPQPTPYGMGYPPDPSAPYGRNQMGEPFSDKQKLTAGLLEIFLGAFGAGRFYLNQPGIAIAQIAVTWLTCGLGHIWPLIDGIMMLAGNVRDERGRPLRD